jgi:hypothetical protein
MLRRHDPDETVYLFIVAEPGRGCRCDIPYGCRPRLGPTHGHVLVDFAGRARQSPESVGMMGLVSARRGDLSMAVVPYDEGGLRGRLRARKLRRVKDRQRAAREAAAPC